MFEFIRAVLAIRRGEDLAYCECGAITTLDRIEGHQLRKHGEFSPEPVSDKELVKRSLRSK